MLKHLFRKTKYLGLIFLLSISCKENLKKKDVVLIGVIGDSTIKKITLNTYRGLFGKPFLNVPIVNGRIKMKFQISKPELFEIYRFGSSHKIYVTPGDSLSFELINKKGKKRLMFNGDNQNHYNFHLFQENDSIKYPIFSNNLNAYKLKCKEIYDQKVNILNRYTELHPEVSKKFQSRILKEMKYKYLYNLMKPKEAIYKSSEADLKEYFNEISAEELNDEGLIDSFYFKKVLMGYIYIFKSKDKTQSFPYNNLLLERDFISENFTGKIKEFAIMKLTLSHYKKLSPNDVDIFKETLAASKPYFSKQYPKEFRNLESNVDKLNARIPDTVLNSKLVDLENNAYTLKTALKESSNKIRVMDFWASWCKPCIDEIKKGINFRKQLAKEKNIEWVYVSIDKDYTKWKNKAIQLKKYGLTKNQFLMEDAKSSNITSFFDLEYIPQYAIIDSKEKLAIKDATRPSDSIVFLNIISQISELER